MATAIFCLLILAAGCGGNAETPAATSIETHETTITRTVTSSTTPTDEGPIMPNVDESQVRGVTDVALAAYDRDWGDGSGVYVVWGPNIVSGWALIGVGNKSGAAGKDVLLHQESGSWQVKDIGHGLSVKWEEQTPPGFWPTG